jgi:hypothetical protein
MSTDVIPVGPMSEMGPQARLRHAPASSNAISGIYGANYPRLGALKDKCDPTNFFRLNQNINPAQETICRPIV